MMDINDTITISRQDLHKAMLDASDELDNKPELDEDPELKLVTMLQNLIAYKTLEEKLFGKE